MALARHRIAKITGESEGIRIFTLAGEAPPYRPGSFFRLWLLGKGGRKIFRPFSAASHPSEGSLCFCIKRNGEFTSMLWKLRAGDEVELDGPFGNFSLGAKDGERVFLAGGAGIAPLRSMLLQTLLEGRRCSLFHSSHTLAELAFCGEMKLLALQNPLFSYFPAVTRQEMPEGWGGIMGRLSGGEIKARLGSLEGRTFYLCGPPGMVSGIAKELAEAGVGKENVKKEEWS